MFFNWEEKEIESGRIWAGVGLPAGKNKGFITIVGEKKFPEIGSRVHHCFLLAEAETAEGDTSQLVEKLAELVGKHKVQMIWGRHHKPAMQFLDVWNTKASERGLPSLYVNKAPDSDDGLIEYHLNVLKDRLFRGQKTLYVPEGSRLKGYIREVLPEEIDTITDSQRPGIASLAYVMTALTLYEPEFEDDEGDDYSTDTVCGRTGY
jgi:hypothetical protein